ncbi:unnamed protein product [Pneumocystis jirovecii]|uniref:MAGE domain-containing protein n=1 Tax=Pneumocystis jirovecii TaxID=42068 RepID=L0P994_PNEJI|nr:unnamed protein product [Pneumocystis jirovecii]
MKTRQQHTKQKENKENIDISNEIPECISESLSQNQKQNISTDVTSTQIKDFLQTKHHINNEDLNFMVKNFIRLALAFEHTRTPIKREDITKKILLPSYPRSFTLVFEKTQEKLRNIFGMELVELPYKNHNKYMSTSQLHKNKNLHAKNLSSVTQSNPKYSELVFQIPTIKEGTFSGIVMIILSIIVMNNGIVSEELLIKYLSHLQMNDDTPIGNLDKILKEMVKKGYLDKIKDDFASTNEKGCIYFLGPRGKIEIDPKRLTNFIEKIQGDTAPHNLKEIVEKLFNKSVSNEP